MKARVSNFYGKRVLILGLGLHGGGAGTAEFFAKHGAKVLVTDLKSRHELEKSLQKLRKFPIRFALGRHRKEDVLGADLIIQNPGVPEDSPFLLLARRHRIPVDTDIGIFFEQCPGFLIGVTGSKGKSTTAALIAHILEQAGIPTILAGNIRTSVLSILPKVQKKSAVVLELSSFQLEGLKPHKKSPHVAVFTNILADHLNRYKNMKEYARAKSIIFRFQSRDDLAILPEFNGWVKGISSGTPSQKFFFCTQKKKYCNAYPEKGGFSVALARATYSVSRQQSPLAGAHNDRNVLAALLTIAALPEHPLWLHGALKKKDIARALKSFRGLEGRLEEIAKRNGVRFVNDTAATIPDATEEAIRAFPKGKIILIAGGMDKGLSYASLARVIRERVKALVLFSGDASDKLLKSLGNKKPPTITGISSTQKAVRSAVEHARTGDTVLLSPAAASFNLFVHEFDRGEQFVRAVHALAPRSKIKI